MKRKLLAVGKIWGPVIAWMTVIFVLSTDIFSSSNTSSLLAPILSSLLPSLSSDEIETYHGIIRKLGHWSEYFILAVLLIRALRAASPRPGRTAHFVTCITIAALYAASDEWHQAFVPSRTSSIIDVALDSFGAFCGLLSFIYISGSKPGGGNGLSRRETGALRKKI